MDLVQKLMNLVLPPIALLMLLFILPPFLVYKFVSFIKRSIYIEDVARKVVLITGASSGIGEHLAYEYAGRGACLVLTARREDRLRQVARKARTLGSPDVIVIRADVSNAEDCERIVREAVDHFGQLDHLVNNAGIILPTMFEDCNNISDQVPVMDINFWGSVYCTRFAVPYLRKSKGKIIVIASCGAWLPTPRMSIYNASKAAQLSFYDTIRCEFGNDIGITIVTPGIIDSELTTENASKIHIDSFPVLSTEGCAKAIVNSACRGDRYLTQPSWMRVTFLAKVICPEIQEWCNRWLLITLPKNSQRSTTRHKTEEKES